MPNQTSTRTIDPELAWWGAYNRGVSLPPLPCDTARSMLDLLPRQVEKGTLSAQAAALARLAIERSTRRLA